MALNASNCVSSRKRLLENMFSLYLLQGLNYVIPIAVLPYLIRVLGVSVYGLVAFSQAFAMYFVSFTEYGFNLSATRYIAKHKDSPEKVCAMFWQVYILKFGLSVIGMIVLAMLIFSIPRFRTDAPYFFWSYMLVVGNVLFPQWYFQGAEKMKYISICTGVAKLLTAAFLFVWVHSPQDGVLAVIFQSSGMLIAGIIGFVVALREIRYKYIMPTLHSMRETLCEGWHLFVSTAAVTLYSNTNLALVGLLAGNVQAGYFSVAEKLVRSMAGLITPAMQAFFPHINSLMAQSRARAIQSISRILICTAICTFVVSVALLVLANPIASLIFGKKAALGSVAVIRWIAFLPFLIGITNVLGMQTMLPLGYDRQFSRIVVFAGLLNICTAIPLIRLMGASGAGISVLFIETCVTLTMALFLYRKKVLFT